jgi:hypothetical protein
MIKENYVKSRAAMVLEAKILRFFMLIVLFCTAVAFSKAAQQSGQNASPPSQATQKAFATPKQASEALIRAAETFDLPELKEILGPDGQDLVASEDPVRDKI